MPRPSKGPRLLKKGKGFVIRWPSENGRRIEKRCSSSVRADAERELAQVILTQDTLDTADDAPIADLVTQYLNEVAVYHESRARTAGAAEKILEFWGALNCSDVRSNRCRAYARYRKETAGISDSTIRRELSILSAALNHARKEGRIKFAPFVHKPKQGPSRDRWLTRSEAAALLKAARQQEYASYHLPLFIMLGLYTGARSSALFGLQWEQIDLVNNRITMNPKGRKQTQKRRPIIPIAPPLKTILRIRRRKTNHPYVLHYDGHPIKSVKKSFATAARTAKIEGVIPHTLRHTCGTWMAQRGVALWKIGGWLGHSQQRTTELYAHHHPDYLSDAAQSFSEKVKGG